VPAGRLAQVEPASGGSPEALKKMAVCYDRAAEIADARDKSYPQLMACVAGICQAVQAGADCDAGVEAQLKALIDAAAPDGADFWELINWADAKMAETILRSESPADELPNLLAAYERASRHVGSPVKLKSVVEQPEFYEDIFSAGARGTEAKRDSIRALATKLRGALEVELLGNHSTP
jgi:hypothetical protein